MPPQCRAPEEFLPERPAVNGPFVELRCKKDPLEPGALFESFSALVLHRNSSPAASR